MPSLDRRSQSVSSRSEGYSRTSKRRTPLSPNGLGALTHSCPCSLGPPRMSISVPVIGQAVGGGAGAIVTVMVGLTTNAIVGQPANR